MKSVSALWAVAEPAVAAQIERAHDAAVTEAVAMIEQRALFTREGTNGVRQVEVQGVVAVAFTHRDSRAGDPDLHSHVAVANKVQTRDGRWLAIDGRVLYAATVTASETYNTALEQHLGERLGLRFADRDSATGQRPVREVVGVDPALTGRWSSRRDAIDVRRADLARRFQAKVGRPPTREEGWRLAQQATEETRARKHEPRTVAEQRVAWHSEAVQVLGSSEAVTAMVTAALHPDRDGADRLSLDRVAPWVAATAGQVITLVEGDRATWQEWHVRAEALRQVRRVEAPTGMSGHLVDLVVGEVLNRCVPLGTASNLTNGPLGDQPREPDVLRRSDGASVYTVSGTDRYTSHRILAAEQRILESAGRADGRRVDRAVLDVALSRAALDGVALNEGQAALVRELASSGRRVQVALAPAGSGKTTALRVLADAWSGAGGTVVGLAPSAAAARVLAEQLDVPTDTLAKFVWSLHPPSTSLPPVRFAQVDRRSLVLIDEAGLADTPTLDAVTGFVLDRGGSVRLIGDDRQLGAVGAGGLLRDLDAVHGAVRLTDVVRFADPAEAAASLALRDGRVDALGFYLDQHRVHVGDATTALDQVFTAWTADRAAGLDTLMLAPTHDLVADLNTRARQHRLDHHQQLDRSGSGHRTLEAPLADGTTASPGDLILCRTNDRRLATSRRQWIRNGDRFLVERVHLDGSLTARTLPKPRRSASRGNTGGHRKGALGNATVVLPAGYVTASVQLGYASTVHAAQGVTCDTVHGIVTGGEGRAQLYTLLTRGRAANHLYLQLGDNQGIHELARPGEPPATTPVEVLERSLTRDDTARSATSLLADNADPASALGDAVARYTDALHVAADHTTADAAKQQLVTLAEHLVPGVTDEPAWPALYSQLLLTAIDNRDAGHALKLAVAAGQLTDAHDLAAVLHHRVADRTAAGGGPLPWLPRVPTHLQQHPTWGPYLAARADLITGLVHQVHQQQSGTEPAWAAHLPSLSPDLTGDVAIWRAAVGAASNDPRPTGAAQAIKPLRRWQQRLDSQLETGVDSHQQTVASIVMTYAHQPQRDASFDRLVGQLAHLTRQGVDIDQPLREATGEGLLPDEHRWAALWWRLHRHLPTDLLTASPPAAGAGVESTAAYVSQLLRSDANEGPASTEETRLDTALAIEGMRRLLVTTAATSQHTDAGPSADTVTDSETELARDRIRDINRATLSFYRDNFRGSWVESYLTDRCRTDLFPDDRFQPGYAPHGWTRLVDHLRRLGVTNTDMITAGVAITSSRHQLIDRFRDRLILPIFTEQHDLVGFVGRRHPNLDEGSGSPKYLNSPTTPLFVKGDQLYGSQLLTPLTASSPTDSSSDAAAERPPAGPAVPVLVEGPLDAVAVTLAGKGRYVGVAPLGTALTPTQAAQLAGRQVEPIVATDPDRAGRNAAHRAFWLLTRHGLDPRDAASFDGLDPAARLQQYGQESLRQDLEQAGQLGDRLLDDAAGRTSSSAQASEALRILAARPPRTWAHDLGTIGSRHNENDHDLRRQLLTLVHQRTREITPLPIESINEGQPAVRRTTAPAADSPRPNASPRKPAALPERPSTLRRQEPQSPPSPRI